MQVKSKTDCRNQTKRQYGWRACFSARFTPAVLLGLRDAITSPPNFDFFWRGNVSAFANLCPPLLFEQAGRQLTGRRRFASKVYRNRIRPKRRPMTNFGSGFGDDHMKTQPSAQNKFAASTSRVKKRAIVQSLSQLISRSLKPNSSSIRSANCSRRKGNCMSGGDPRFLRSSGNRFLVAACGALGGISVKTF